MLVDKLFLQFLPHWDLGVVIGTFILFLFLGLVLGRRQMLLFIFAAYGGWTSFQALPRKGIEGMKIVGVDVKILIFLGLAVVIYLFLSFSGFRFSKSTKSKGTSIFLGILYSVLLAGFLLSFCFSLLQHDLQSEVSAITYYGFIRDYAHFAWSVLPLGGIILFNKR